MTEQETFDLCASHMLRQGVTSVIGQTCRYRGHKGRMCPVGSLIPDADYRKDIEGLSVLRKRVAKILRKHGHNLNLLAAFQHIHDSLEPEEWRMQLEWLAEAWNLSPSILHKTVRLPIARSDGKRPVKPLSIGMPSPAFKRA